MAKVVVLGAGISGHTAAGILKEKLKQGHEVIVISPNSQWNWIPSNIWVGVGAMKAEDVTFALAPVYKRLGIKFIQAKAVSLHPEGSSESNVGFVTIEHTSIENKGKIETVSYDYLINATGPKLNFDATPGLGPHKNSLSVCTFSHAEEANKKLNENIELMKKGQNRTFLIGTGHATCTCQGAAFEYIFNVEHKLRREGVRDKAEIIWISNEYELGDFGIGGMHLKRGGYVTSARMFAESLYTERGIKWLKRSAPIEIFSDRIKFKTLDGFESEQKFDFAMLLPPFTGVDLKAFGKNGEDLTEKLFAKNQMMKVDADYTVKKYEDWKATDWPSTYQSPLYKNLFAIGIAFAPPHQISKPMTAKDGTLITPAPPRTGMPSGMMGRAVALSVVDMINGAEKPTHKASLANLGASCIASAGASFFNGSAVAMTIYPIVPDFEKYPVYGRDLKFTFAEVGLAGHWIKHILHYMFIYKAKGYPGSSLIPE